MARPSGTVFVVNPASANGSTGKRWPEIRKRAAAVGLDGEARISGGPGDISALTRNAVADGADLIVAVGGDGTVNEAVNGLLRTGPDRVELAVLPGGTGDDFARTFHI